MPSKRVLQERVHGHELLRRQEAQWERDRRREDREERFRKDEELNGVRLQLRDQAATFATKDMLQILERGIDKKLDILESNFNAKLDHNLELLNSRGTEGFRENEAERHGREQATKEILEATATNHRWLIGLSVTVVMSLIGSIIAILALILHTFAK